MIYLDRLATAGHIENILDNRPESAKNRQKNFYLYCAQSLRLSIEDHTADNVC
jgi:hypothetical protein